jgi:hypothetical protein
VGEATKVKKQIMHLCSYCLKEVGSAAALIQHQKTHVKEAKPLKIVSPFSKPLPLPEEQLEQTIEEFCAEMVNDVFNVARTRIEQRIKDKASKVKVDTRKACKGAAHRKTYSYSEKAMYIVY